MRTRSTGAGRGHCTAWRRCKANKWRRGAWLLGRPAGGLHPAGLPTVWGVLSGPAGGPGTATNRACYASQWEQQHVSTSRCEARTPPLHLSSPVLPSRDYTHVDHMLTVARDVRLACHGPRQAALLHDLVSPQHRTCPRRRTKKNTQPLPLTASPSQQTMDPKLRSSATMARSGSARLPAVSPSGAGKGILGSHGIGSHTRLLRPALGTGGGCLLVASVSLSSTRARVCYRLLYLRTGGVRSRQDRTGILCPHVCSSFLLYATDYPTWTRPTSTCCIPTTQGRMLNSHQQPKTTPTDAAL